MLTQPQVQRYSADSGLRDIMIAEKEVVLTFLLQLLSERGILNRLAFKGETCLRKMFIGSHLGMFVGMLEAVRAPQCVWWGNVNA
jgi:predicted nucleotidyltransferase component of viral defense system